MLKINNKEYKTLSETIKFTRSKINNKTGYSLLFEVDFKYKENEYLTFYIDFLNDKDFKKIENKTYTKEKIKMFELFTNKNFIDHVDGNILLRFGKINNNLIETTLKIDGKEVILEYNGMLSINKD